MQTDWRQRIQVSVTTRGVSGDGRDNEDGQHVLGELQDLKRPGLGFGGTQDKLRSGAWGQAY
jgi:hypothetical protein